MRVASFNVEDVPAPLVAALVSDRIDALASDLDRSDESFLGVSDSALVAIVLRRQCEIVASIAGRLDRADEGDGTSLSGAESEIVAGLLRLSLDHRQSPT